MACGHEVRLRGLERYKPFSDMPAFVTPALSPRMGRCRLGGGWRAVAIWDVGHRHYAASHHARNAPPPLLGWGEGVPNASEAGVRVVAVLPHT
jgi:hypothetical protein